MVVPVSTVTCVAVIVVLSTCPSTSTVSPFLIALTDAGLVAVSYVVADVSSTVTFSPADVDMLNSDPDTLLIVPSDPPAAGPDRALDPPPLRGAVDADEDVDGDVVAAELAVELHPAIPITTHVPAATAIDPLFLR